MGSQRHIFISTTYLLSAQQQEFVALLLDELRHYSFETLTVPRTLPDGHGPIAAIRSAIQISQATLVVAFTRLAIVTATEYPETPYAVRVDQRAQCTVWNQIEAAMALQAGHPILVLAQTGLHPEGILSPRNAPMVSFSLGDEIAGRLTPSLRDALGVWLSSLKPSVSAAE